MQIIEFRNCQPPCPTTMDFNRCRSQRVNTQHQFSLRKTQPLYASAMGVDALLGDTLLTIFGFDNADTKVSTLIRSR